MWRKINPRVLFRGFSSLSCSCWRMFLFPPGAPHPGLCAIGRYTVPATTATKDIGHSLRTCNYSIRVFLKISRGNFKIHFPVGETELFVEFLQFENIPIQHQIIHSKSLSKYDEKMIIYTQNFLKIRKIKL